MTKPVREFKFDTSKINIEPIGNAREVGGYGEREVVSHENLNDMMANISDWILYLSKITGKSIYVDRTGGDDSTGDGTEDNPYLTPAKAINEAENYGINFIKLMTSGDHDITENVQVADKTIFILEESGVEARLRFYNYYSTTNRLYGINLKRSKIFIALTDGVKVAGPTNPGAAWSSTDNVCFLVDEGESEINIVGKVEATALSAASGNPVFVRQDYSSAGAKGHGRAKLAIHGNIDTEGELYILDSNGALAQIQYAGTMDRPEYWFKKPRAFKYELGLDYDGSNTTFVFGGTKWTGGTFGVFEKTVDTSNPFQDFFDLVYGEGNTIVTAEDTGTETVLIVEIAKGDLMPLHFKHENTSTSTTTYGIALPQKINNFVVTNF